MGAKGQQWGNWAPVISPPLDAQRDYDDSSSHWRSFDNSVNALSFGFVATAVLISMFLVMAIFERFLRPHSTANESRRYHGDVEAQIGFHGKFRFPSPKISTNPREVSVLMPGDNIPTFIAQPAPVPCAPERISWPPHQHITPVQVQVQVQAQSVGQRTT